MRKIRKAIAAALLTVTASAALAIGTACGKKNDVTFSFQVDGGVEISNVVKKKGEEFTLPIPEKEGYQFEGWYTSADFQGQPVTSVVAEGNVTYYAKWSQLYAITLDLNGGTLATTTVYAKEGANVYEAVKDCIPTKSGLTFGGWFNGEKELSKNTRLTSAGLTLTAQYKVEYTVEIYLQNVDNDEYALSEFGYTASDYVNKTVTLETELDGCTYVEMDGEILSKALSATASENLFKVYFNRNVYTVMFNPNYPGGGEEGAYSVEAKYGEEIDVPSNVSEYFREGYCMLGWSTSATSGEITYAADLDALLYNGNGGENKGHKITVQRTTALYGVWQAGYTDVFGGDDYIYFFEGEESAVYLARGNVFFKGEYNAKDSTFAFYDYSKDEFGDLIIRGKILDGGKFLYSDSNRTKDSSVLYIPGEGVNENVKIRFDALNGITYTVYDEETGREKESSTGTYEVVSTSEYRATFTEGAKAGEAIYFLVGTINGEPAFQVRNDEEFNAGKFCFTGMMQNELGGYTIAQREDVTIEFDGFSTATFTQGSSVTRYNYRKNEQGRYVFTDSNDNVMGVVCLTKDMNVNVALQGFFFYEEALDNTFETEDGASLTLDGVGFATYEKDGKTMDTYYTAKTMPMGGTLVSFVDEKNEYEAYNYLITSKEEGVYEVRNVLSTYAEYYYKSESGAYYSPMLVLDEHTAGMATLYGYTSAGEFVKVSEGTYTDNGDGTYLFERTETFDGEGALDQPIDPTTVRSFVFATDSGTFGYSVHYWYSSNDGENKYFVDYTSGEGSLKLVGGIAYYKADKDAPMARGSYSKSGDVLVFEDQGDKMHYFSLNEEEKTFEVLSYAPYTAYLLGSDNKSNAKYTLAFDGKGGATYTVEGEGGEKTTCVGRVSVTTNKTEFDKEIQLFTSEDGTVSFEYILVSSGASTAFLLKDESYAAGRYVSTQSEWTGVLTLDGYCYQASYRDRGETYSGNYYVQDGVIVLRVMGGTYYLDVLSEGMVSVRGEEYGEYALLENQHASGLYFEMDGYGKISVFTLEKDGDSYKRVYVAQDGTYVKEGDEYTIIYGEGENQKVYLCKNNGYSFLADDGERYKVLSNNQEIEKSILIDTSDWSVLILDEFGMAIKYNEAGQKQEGTYTRITQNLLYFINKQGSDACLYDYNMETGAASPIELKARNYYTTDLRCLSFTKYGFAIFNGDTENLIFYNYEGDNVIIYRRPTETDVDVEYTEYGFVKDNFGTLTEEKEYNGKTYYRNAGSEIIFEREVENVEKYPIYIYGQKWTVNDVSFAPTGGAEFSVSATANVTVERTVDGETTTQETSMSCFVERAINAETGKAEMYVLLAGGFRLYITATYTGKSGATNTYKAYDLRFSQELPAYRYLDVLYRVYAMYGASSANAFENTVGTVKLSMDFDENGKEESNTMSAEFGENSLFYDTNGVRLEGVDARPFYSLDNGLYYVEITRPDEHVYRLYFAMQQHAYLGATGYFVYAFTRVQELTVDEYTVTVSRVVGSEVTGVELGSVFAMEIEENGVSLGNKYMMTTPDELFEANGVTYYVVREKAEEGYAVSATYYAITLEENENSSVEEEGKEIFPTYKAVKVEKAQATIMHESEEVKRYVEIVDNKITLLSLHDNVYYVKECTYADGVYTLKTTNGRSYKVTVDGENVVIEQI